MVDVSMEESFEADPVDPEEEQMKMCYISCTGEYFTKIRGPPPSGKKSASWQKLVEKS